MNKMPNIKYKLQLGKKAYRAAERETFSEIPEVSARADNFLELWMKNQKEGLTKEEYQIFKRDKTYYFRREVEFKSL